MSAHKIALRIPEGTPWPVVERNHGTGDIILEAGFLECLAEASGLAWRDDASGRVARLSQEMVSAFLVAWYSQRIAAGAARCPIMDALIQEAAREGLNS